MQQEYCSVEDVKAVKLLKNDTYLFLASYWFEVSRLLQATKEEAGEDSLAVDIVGIAAVVVGDQVVQGGIVCAAVFLPLLTTKPAENLFLLRTKYSTGCWETPLKARSRRGRWRMPVRWNTSVSRHSYLARVTAVIRSEAELKVEQQQCSVDCGPLLLPVQAVLLPRWLDLNPTTIASSLWPN